MNEAGLLAALLAGVLGAGHCLSMCGALATAGSGCGRCPWRESFAERLAYNGGRIASYAVAGALAGALGAGVGRSAEQVAATLALGLPAGALVRSLAALVMVYVGLRLLLRGQAWLRWPEVLAMRVFGRVAPRLASSLAGRGGAAADTGGAPPAGVSLTRRAALGALWGWLPCGLSYSMILVALATGSAAAGAAFMLAFGLGTLPAMLGIGLLGRRAAALRTGPTSTIAGWLMIVFGALVATSAGAPLLPGGGAHASMPHAVATAPTCLPPGALAR